MWVTPEEFELAVKIERREGGAGFGALLAAAVLTDTDYGRSIVMGNLWPHSLNSFHWEAGQWIADEYEDCRFVVFMSAAALHADLENQRKIEQICPGLNEELSHRYNTACGLMPGEQCLRNGVLWECVDELRFGMTYGHKVVEATHE